MNNDLKEEYNDLMKYVSRLEGILKLYEAGGELNNTVKKPLDELEINIPPWINNRKHMQPLLLAYDQHIQQLKQQVQHLSNELNQSYQLLQEAHDKNVELEKEAKHYVNKLAHHVDTKISGSIMSDDIAEPLELARKMADMTREKNRELEIQLQTLQSEMKTKDDTILQLQMELSNISTQYDELCKTTSTLQVENKQLNEELNNYKNQLMNQNNETTNNASTVSKLQAQLQILLENENKQKEDISVLELQCAELRHKNESNTNESQQYVQMLNEMKVHLSSLMNDKKKLEEQLNDQNEELDSTTKMMEKLLQDQTQWQQNESKLLKQMNDNHVEKETALNEIKNLQLKLLHARGENERMEKKIQEVWEERSALNEVELETEKNYLNEKENELNTQLIQSKQEINALKVTNNHLSEEYKSIKLHHDQTSLEITNKIRQLHEEKIELKKRLIVAEKSKTYIVEKYESCKNELETKIKSWNIERNSLKSSVFELRQLLDEGRHKISQSNEQLQYQTMLHFRAQQRLGIQQKEFQIELQTQNTMQKQQMSEKQHEILMLREQITDLNQMNDESERKATELLQTQTNLNQKLQKDVKENLLKYQQAMKNVTLEKKRYESLLDEYQSLVLVHQNCAIIQQRLDENMAKCKFYEEHSHELTERNTDLLAKLDQLEMAHNRLKRQEIN